MGLDAPITKILRDEIAGTSFLEPEFRVGVKVAADLLDFRLELGDAVDEVHEQRSLQESPSSQAYPATGRSRRVESAVALASGGSHRVPPARDSAAGAQPAAGADYSHSARASGA